MDLRSTPLAGRGLIGALRELPKELEESLAEPVPITIEHEGMEAHVASAVEVGLYHIVREALANVLRHARATAASVRVTQSGGRLRVRIVDDGIGFDVSRLPAQRFGLLGMSERARLLGGELRITSAPDAGTVVDVDVPLDRRVAIEAGDAAAQLT
jgi:signal transduction histidine kinase